MKNRVDFESVSLTPISKAPSRHELETQADRRKVPVEVVFKEERERWYKAKGRSGGTVQVRNPAAWERRPRVENWQRKDGSFYQVRAESFYRPKPEPAVEGFQGEQESEGYNI